MLVGDFGEFRVNWKPKFFEAVVDGTSTHTKESCHFLCSETIIWKKKCCLNYCVRKDYQIITKFMDANSHFFYHFGHPVLDILDPVAWSHFYFENESIAPCLYLQWYDYVILYYFFDMIRLVFVTEQQGPRSGYFGAEIRHHSPPKISLKSHEIPLPDEKNSPLNEWKILTQS